MADRPDPAQQPRSLLHSFGINPQRLGPLARSLLALSLLLSAVAVVVSVTDVAGRYGGIDIRNRVVGARVLAEGGDPYTFRWQPGMPERLLDPVHGLSPVARVTVPPTGLCLYQAISWMPYGPLRLVHLALEWLALLASVMVLTRMVPRQELRVAFLVTAAIFFAFGAAWRMHTERGQVYVFHLLLLSLGASRCLRTRLDSWWGGIAFGLAAALRPNLAPIALAFLVLGKFRTAGGTIAAGLVAVVLTLPFAGPSVWKSYFAMGDEYYLLLWAPERLPAPPEGVPLEAEGFTFARVIVDADSPSSSFARFYSENRDAYGLPRLDLGRVSKAILVVILALLVGLLALKRRPRSPRATLALILVLLLGMEYFLPHRWPYVDVHWLLPLALTMPYFLSRRAVPQAALVAVLAGLFVGNALSLTTLPFTTTLARTYLLAGGLTTVAVWAYLRRRTPGAEALEPSANSPR
jgi:hypothetical protein